MVDRDPLEAQVERLHDEAEELLSLASARAEAGHSPIAEKLTQVAAELETKSRRLKGSAIDPTSAEVNAQEFRLRAEELYAIAASLRNLVAQEGLLRAAESCERIADSLEKMARLKR